ncbi:MAG: hypothetical protein COT43_11975 [Candidatus Marinimicrobia bacterium CG08_land_8_20_14_0_20_45_22]|nr:MAG: hypothetical protein COT43_11975 [Candidatus Marinimicrobia bacterium CG08_land_8_20_14_0_20_45_22]
MKISVKVVSILCFCMAIGLAGEKSHLPNRLRYKQIKKEIPKDFASAYRKAEKSIEAGDWKTAESKFSEILKKEENFYAVWGLAWTLAQQKDILTAKKEYLRALALNDSSGAFLKDFFNFSRYEFKSWDLTAQIATILYKCTRTDEALYLLIESAEPFECPLKCLEKLKDLTVQFPDRPNVAVFYATYLMDMGRSTEAVAAAKKASRLAEDPFHLELLVYILTNNGYFLDAAKVCEKLSEISPRSAHTYEAWGFLEYKQGNFRNAELHYRKALNKNYDIQNLLMLARLNHFNLNDTPKAGYYCRSVLQINPNSVDALYLLSEIARKQGNLDKALLYSQREIDLSPDKPHSFYYHGKLLYEKKEYEKAVRYLLKAVEHNPEIRRYRLVLAKAYAGMGNVVKAKETYSDYLNESLNDLWKEEEMLKGESPIIQHP